MVAVAVVKMVRLNLCAPMRLTRRLAPKMVEQGGGVIINIASIAAMDPLPDVGSYVATKSGLRGWSRSCYQSLRHHNIKVVCINPGVVRTDAVR